MSTPQDWRCLAVRHVPLRPTTSPLLTKILPVSGKYHVCLGPPAQPMKQCFARKRDPTIWCHIKADICLPNRSLFFVSANATLSVFVRPKQSAWRITLACHVVRRADRDMGLAYNRSDSYNPSVGP